MTYNVRRSVPPHFYQEWFSLKKQWWRRRRMISALVARELPDILCLQEARSRQVSSLLKAFPDFDVAAHPRSSQRNDETVAVLWDRRRYRLVWYRHRWLSDRPESVGSRSWGNRLPRMVTVVRLCERSGGGEFLLANTHLDNRSIKSRHESARVLADIAADADCPVVVTGDFNHGQVSKTHGIVTSGVLEDAWDVAEERLTPEWKTFNSWEREPTMEGSRIDWIAVTSDVRVEAIAINTDVEGQCPPSDHWPVQARLVLGR
ncbi:endonuclease/exonuclease/phosphatase family protein [Haloglycomyces albus]|uniref:endonuclease/exonuclease/phosphatase family protein n=1 Tax=Haloglycomyces albus TaxID=526067 RepID=UPI0006844772|nr:endonuclease/exonuclease/phosphatase family protein [Haloglycomyces albus]